MGRTWFCSAIDPRDEQHLHRAAAKPVALLVVRTLRPRPRRSLAGIMARKRRIPLRRPSPRGHSAVDEQPMVPTLPFDHGCEDIHEIASVPSDSGCAQNVVVPFGKRNARAHSSRRKRTRA